MLFLRDLGRTEVGGFGITPPDDLLLVEDVRLVQQKCTAVTVEFDDAAVADFFDEQVDQGRTPEQFARIWLHTHPGGSASPSHTDEETFARCFGGTDWSLMFIVAREGETYARLKFNVGPGAPITLAVDVDYAQSFPATCFDDWLVEYKANVQDQDWQAQSHRQPAREQPSRQQDARELVVIQGGDREFVSERPRWHEMSPDDWERWENPYQERGGFADDVADNFAEDGWGPPTTEEWWDSLSVDHQLENLEWMARQTCQRLAEVKAGDACAPQPAAILPASESLTTGVSA